MAVGEGRGRRNQEGKYRTLFFLEGVAPIKFHKSTMFIQDFPGGPVVETPSS